MPHCTLSTCTHAGPKSNQVGLQLTALKQSQRPLPLFAFLAVAAVGTVVAMVTAIVAAAVVTAAMAVVMVATANGIATAVVVPVMVAVAIMTAATAIATVAILIYFVLASKVAFLSRKSLLRNLWPHGFALVLLITFPQTELMSFLILFLSHMRRVQN